MATVAATAFIRGHRTMPPNYVDGDGGARQILPHGPSVSRIPEGAT
jgi:hypothetical protein